MAALKIVRVDWLDAQGGVRIGWRPIAESVAAEPAKAISVGVLVRKTRKALIVCPHMYGHETGDVAKMAGDGEIAIPKDWVTKLTVLGTL